MTVSDSFPTRRSSDLDPFGPWRTRRPVRTVTHEPGDVVPFRSMALLMLVAALGAVGCGTSASQDPQVLCAGQVDIRDRKSTRLNSSHITISYAVFCLK